MKIKLYKGRMIVNLTNLFRKLMGKKYVFIDNTMQGYRGQYKLQKIVCWQDNLGNPFEILYGQEKKQKMAAYN